VYDGSTDLKERSVLINEFQSGKIDLLVIQIDAGKEGITLDRAEKIIFLDQVPPASDIQQAQDRFIATTEDKAAVPKEIIYLMMADTYDEVLYDLVEQRAAATDIINNYKYYITKE
jgi:SNF2 family DNA or RNA helicase